MLFYAGRKKKLCQRKEEWFITENGKMTRKDENQGEKKRSVGIRRAG
jgi:hypothetical protein